MMCIVQLAIYNAECIQLLVAVSGVEVRGRGREKEAVTCMTHCNSMHRKKHYIFMLLTQKMFIKHYGI